jgi:hypothetical protein
MKPILLLLVATLFFSCKNNTESVTETTTVEPQEQELSLEGAWELVSYYNYENDAVSDTILSSETNKQIKMYSTSRVMWSRYRDSDSLDWFGYGNYTIEDGRLSEVLEYGSKSMNQVIAEQNEFVFDLILEKDKFSQVELDEKGRPFYAENYVRIE